LHELAGSPPPKTHDLIYLLKLADVHMPDHLLEFPEKSTAQVYDLRSGWQETVQEMRKLGELYRLKELIF
jgi:hypothetical protein